MRPRPSLVAAAGGVAATVIVFSLWRLRGQFLVIRVSGFSMVPSFRPGERVIVRRGRPDRLSVGAVVVVRAPDGSPAPRAPWVIKRLAALPGDPVPDSLRAAAGGVGLVPEGKLALLSDNPAGTDSRHWGLLPVGDLLGLVIARLSPDARHPMVLGPFPATGQPSGPPASAP